MAIRSYQRLATSFKLRTSRSFPYPAEDVRYSQVDRDDVRSSRAPAWTYSHPFVGAHSWNAPLLPPTKIEALVVKRPIENADVEDYLYSGWWSRKNSDSSAMACCTVPCHLEGDRQRSRAMRVRQTKHRKGVGRVAAYNRRGVGVPLTPQGKLGDSLRVLDFQFICLQQQ